MLNTLLKSKSTDNIKWFLLKKVIRDFRLAYIPAFANFAFFQGVNTLERTTPLKFVKHQFLRPVALLVQVNKVCNFSCSFCFVNDLNEKAAIEFDLVPADFEKMLDQSLLRSLLRIGFTGGEPFMHRKIFDFIEYSKRTIPVVTVNTNFALAGRKFQGERYLDRMNKSSLDMITISLYEPNVKDIEEYAPQLSNDMFRRLSFVVSNGQDPFHSYKRMPEVIEMAIRAGFQNIYFQNFDTMEGVSEQKANLNKMDISGFTPITRDEEYLEVRDRVLKDYGDQIEITLPVPKATPTDMRQTFNCYQPDFQIGVDAKGTLAPCCNLDRLPEYGNLFTQENWNNKAFQKIRAGIKLKSELPTPYCANCTFLNVNFHEL
jgi:MoaA/NifB/PqqE/SkfB family radical SAM enzyme